MKNTIYIFTGLALSLIPFSLSCETRKEESPMNVLFLSVDDLWPALACYGDPLAITPNIDALAAQAFCLTDILFRFPHALPPAPACLPD